jgi:SAM-dependent methyltransferase
MLAEPVNNNHHSYLSDVQDSSWFEPKACLYCSATEFVPWLSGVQDHLEYVSGLWTFVKCINCGSIQLKQMPKEEKIAKLYPPIYSFRPDFEGGGTLKQLVTALEKRAFYNLMNCREVESVKRVSGIPGGTMLDVGCGTGARLSRYAAAGFQVRGLEIQPELVQYIRKKLGIEADCGTLATVAYEPESFDIVTAHWVIEHLTNVHWALKKIYEMLKPGGWLVAEVPLADSWQGQVL